MKTIAIIAVCGLMISGCATADTNTIPQGKTEADWETATQYCLDRAGVKTGFWAANPVAAAMNVSARERYKQCLVDTGWLVEEAKK